MDDSSTRQSILRQYRAGLDMLRQAVDSCPEGLWFSDKHKNRFWHIAYHAAFFTHLYLQPSEHEFQPWVRHVPESNYLGPQPWAKNAPWQIPEPYSKADVVEYLGVCREEAEQQILRVRFDAASGFSWLPLDKLELQFYNIRHLQHHTGQLVERLRSDVNIGVGWVGWR